MIDWRIYMLKALYYPHTEIVNPIVIKNALLLWDEIETIVPDDHLPIWSSAKNHDLAEAGEIVIRRRIPTNSEQRTTHKAITEILDNKASEDILNKDLPGWEPPRFSVYEQKFMMNTWDMLQQRGLVKQTEGMKEFEMPPVLGFLMMSLLADTCAGSQIQKVTDRVEAYRWLSQYNAVALGSEYFVTNTISQEQSAYDRLVDISLKLLDARKVPIRKLIEFRKREAKHGGTHFSQMRGKYSETLQIYINRLGKEAKNQSDFEEIERQFTKDMENDLSDLKTELGMANTNALLSKEVVLTIVILAGCFINPFEALTSVGTEVGGVAIVPLLKGWINYRGSRKAALQKHPMSLLYLANQSHITAY